VEGTYQVRGWAKHDGEPRKQCVVSVVARPDGILACNLHRETSDHNVREWYLVDDLDPEFEWRGPQHFIMADERRALADLLRNYEKVFDTDDDGDFNVLSDLAQRLGGSGP
jgi:hypothetical protein